MRRVFLELTRRGQQLFFNDRRLHDIVAAAVTEHWAACADHDGAILEVIRRLVQDGRNGGEFERKTPMDETCRAIMLAMEPVLIRFHSSSVSTPSKRMPASSQAWFSAAWHHENLRVTY